MRAALVKRVGAPPEPAEKEAPAPGAGQALIRVAAVALNPVEVRVAAGRMPQEPQPPYVPGLEGVGTVVHSEKFPSGARVRFENDLPGFGKDGALQELAVADEEALVQLPAAVSDGEAAAAGVVGVTSHLALRRAGLVAGESVAVLGATGGVGQMALQLARFYGASRVVAVGRHAPTLEVLESRGADVSVRLDGEDLTERLLEVSDGGIDLVIDTLWGAPAMSAIGALSVEGRLVNVGNNAGTDVQLPLGAMRQMRTAVIGLSSGWAPIPDKVAAYRAVVEALADGNVTVAHEVVALDEVAEAWRRQEEFPHTKLVIGIT